jgi:hypothetical protein
MQSLCATRPTDVLAVNFEVVDRLGRTAERDAGDLGCAGDRTERFADFELASFDKLLAVLAPERVIVGHANRLVVAFNGDVQQLTG